MRLTWKNRLEKEPHLKNIESWPHIDLDMLKDSKRKIFLRNIRIITDVLSNN